MNLLIQNMDMPNSCKECRVCSIDFDWFNCPLGRQADGRVLDLENYNDEFIYTESRHPDCPLREIPTPHGRLIDADKLTKVIEDALNRKDNPLGYDAIEILGEIYAAKTIIEADE
jgi:hypothetical protein